MDWTQTVTCYVFMSNILYHLDRMTLVCLLNLKSWVMLSSYVQNWQVKYVHDAIIIKEMAV